MGEKKKSDYVFLGILLAIILMVAYLLSGLFTIAGLNINNIQQHIQYIITHPFERWWNDKSGTCMLLSSVAWLMIVMNYITRMERRLIRGKEFGDSKWLSPKAFNRTFADKTEENNRILSKDVRMSYDTHETGLNNNMTVVGGSGTGKTAYVMTPNLLNLHDNNVYTDPKGGLLQDFGNFLLERKIRVWTINLCDMEQSMCYNPFRLIRTASDLRRLITNIIANTTPENAGPSNESPFWQQAERMFLESIFYYVWMECPKTENDVVTGGKLHLPRSFRTVLKLMDEESIDDSGADSLLGIRMKQLAQGEHGENHPALIRYNRSMTGAADTKRTVLMSAQARFNAFDDPQLLRILDDNDIYLEELGIGKRGDESTKTSLFLIIPDDDDTYNFVAGMLYTQLSQELYRQAKLYGGSLPMDVGLWLDEFANIKMPANFDKLLATMRSRGMYCTIVLQSLAQLKKLFKNGGWEGIVGNTDTFLYLGGNEQTTWKYVSEMLGKWTAGKQTDGETLGKNGSSSKNFDVLGRELLNEAEVRKLKNSECICLVRGQDPIRDEKLKIWNTKLYKHAKKLGPYTYYPEKKAREKSDEVEILNKQELSYYKRCQEKGEKVEVIEIDPISLLTFDIEKFKKEKETEYIPLDEIRAMMQEPEVQKKISEQEELEMQQDKEKQIQEQREAFNKMDLLGLFSEGILSPEQKEIAKRCIEKGVGERVIKKVIHPDNTKEKTKEMEELAIMLAEKTARLREEEGE